jgi:hypothetical protein
VKTKRLKGVAVQSEAETNLAITIAPLKRNCETPGRYRHFAAIGIGSLDEREGLN